MNSPEKISQVFGELDYKVSSSLQPFSIHDLGLISLSTEVLWNIHLYGLSSDEIKLIGGASNV